MERIWNCYRQAAERAGRDPVTGKSYAFSLEFFYCNTRPQDQNALVRAFLGDGTVQLGRRPAAAIETIRQHVSQQPPLYDAQLAAIQNALACPVSLVQGPPGTGKTETILSLLAVILALRPGSTVAVVSTNNEAIDNIISKIEQDRHHNPALQRVHEKLAVLGRRDKVREWRKKRREAGEDVSAIDQASGTIDYRYLQRYPIFTSTVHSMRKIFTGRDFDQQFDFVIADECSQMSLMLGVIAMSCAKQLVLIGDNEQLPPVIPSEVEEGFAQHHEVPEIYHEAQEKSFLSACGALFPAAPSVFLDRHYRCHPSIIGFCNRHVYDGRLVVATPDDGQFRMRAVWYEGDYCEKVTERLPARREGETERLRRKIYNKRQIEIFLREELPRLLPRLRDPAFTAAVLSPFRYQIELLGERLREALDAAGLDGGEVFDNLAELDEQEIPRLTIHKAQGKGFDAVFLMPVEDYYREDPWCQRRRITNVAVSRAKQEFCVITSSQWLPEDAQQRLTGYILPNGEENEPEDGMYIRKLLRYITGQCPQPQGEFGLHRSGMTSVFDGVPRCRRVFSTTGAELLSAPARCFAKALFERFGEEYDILAELPMREIEQSLTVPGASRQQLYYRDSSRIDFALCKEGRVRLMLEVDGEQHRDDDPAQAARDHSKDIWMRELLRAGERYRRIPTDGSTTNELEELAALLAQEPGGPALTVPAGTIRRLAVQTRAQYTSDLLLRQLAAKVDEAHFALREHFARPDLTLGEKLEAVHMDYTAPQAVRYSSAVSNGWYLCRYAVAYAFEYAMLCELAMRLRMSRGERSFSAFSFGAGSFLDAWAMAYAKARLTLEDPAYDAIQLYYKGVDEEEWPGYFVQPTRVCRGGDYVRRIAETPEGRQVDALFEKVWLWHGRIDDFFCKDILARRERRVYYNVLVFPKIINELTDEDLDVFERMLRQAVFSYEEYYLLVSHSRADLRGSAAALKRLLRAIDPAGEFLVSCDYPQLLREVDALHPTPDGRPNQAHFEEAWLGRDHLISLAGEDAELAPFRCYAFASASPAGTEHAAASPYIERHNPDFGYDGPRRFLRGIDELAQRENAGPDGLRANQVTKVTNIVFDIVRLRRR